MNTRRRFRVFSSITTAALALALAAGVASADRRDQGPAAGPPTCDHDRDHASGPPSAGDRDGRMSDRDDRASDRDGRDGRDGDRADRDGRMSDRDARDGDARDGDVRDGRDGRMSDRAGRHDDRDARSDRGRGRHARHRQASPRLTARPLPPMAQRGAFSKLR